MSKFLGFDQVLCLSPHPDDVELSMFGTIAKYQDTLFKIMCLSYGTRGDETSNEKRFREIGSFWSKSGIKNWYLINSYGFITDFYEDEWIKILERDFDHTIGSSEAIFTPSEFDSQFEHVIVSHIGLALARYKQISLIQYKSTSTQPEWTPNLFVDINEFYKQKIDLLFENIPSQADNFSHKVFDAEHTNAGCVKRGMGMVEEYKIKTLYE